MSESISAPKARLSPLVRVVVVAVVVAILWVIAWATGLLDLVDVETIRAVVRSAGAWGVVVFLVGFCLANLLQVPGTIFIVVGIVAFGDVTGSVLSWFGATLSVSTTFLVFRGLGGQALGELRHPWARRLIGGLERRPELTVALLRTFMQASPVLNAALALSPIRFHRYVIGSAVGLVVPVLMALLLTEWFL